MIKAKAVFTLSTSRGYKVTSRMASVEYRISLEGEDREVIEEVAEYLAELWGFSFLYLEDEES